MDTGNIPEQGPLAALTSSTLNTQALHLQSFADKQTRDESHVVQLKFIAGSKLSFTCVSQSQKIEWLTAILKALSALYNVYYIII